MVYVLIPHVHVLFTSFHPSFIEESTFSSLYYPACSTFTSNHILHCRAYLCWFVFHLFPSHSNGNARSAWCWSARQNRFRDPGGTEQCHHRSPNRHNLSPSALSEVIRGRTDSRLMGGIFSSATPAAPSISYLLLNSPSRLFSCFLFLQCSAHLSFSCTMSSCFFTHVKLSMQLSSPN